MTTRKTNGKWRALTAFLEGGTGKLALFLTFLLLLLWGLCEPSLLHHILQNMGNPEWQTSLP